MKEPSKVAGYVHKDSRGTFVLAQFDGNQYVAPMTKEARKITGCLAVYGGTVDSISESPNVYKYKNREGALRGAWRVFGEEAKEET